ncbi:unnamed protein product [marine sediment metagenome]|uniref:Uncharacterized protein n=1 Tax=marine sediment metagenome TaxID=412755 RepID=X1HXJ0_9ZZZZ
MKKEEIKKKIWERAVKEDGFRDNQENYEANEKLIEIAIEETLKLKK